jgi:hypothetical protein
LHHAVMTITHDTVNKSAPLELAAIIGNVANLHEQVRTWCTFAEQLGVHAQFSASLKLLEACYPAVRNAAVYADIILKGLYHRGSVVLPSQTEFEDSLERVKLILPVLEDNLKDFYFSAIKPVIIEGHIEFRHRDTVLPSEHLTPSYVGFQFLGVIGSEPSFELACHLVSAARSQEKSFCVNCGERPVAAHTRCFADWCHLCDYSLWSTRPRTGSIFADHDQSAVDTVPRPANECQELQCRGFLHDHHFSIPQ